jgi:acetoacetate decarboxylase
MAIDCGELLLLHDRWHGEGPILLEVIEPIVKYEFIRMPGAARGPRQWAHKERISPRSSC